MVSSNYYNNLKKIDIYHNEKVDELNNINFSTKINSSEENELINLGIIFHRIDTDHEHYYKFQVYKDIQRSNLLMKFLIL